MQQVRCAGRALRADKEKSSAARVAELGGDDGAGGGTGCVAVKADNAARFHFVPGLHLH
jgi:hypothetical protein